MALDWMINDPEQYVSRGRRIRSVLDGSGSVELLPGKPDVPAEQSDWDKGEKFDPEVEFDPNAYSRFDKFDGLEFGQEIVDSSLDDRPKSSPPAAAGSPFEEK